MKRLNNFFLKKIFADLDLLFFAGFLLTFTFSLRKIILPGQIEGSFSEYISVFFYISDAFLLLSLFLWIVLILNNRSSSESIVKLVDKLLKNFYTQVIHRFLGIFGININVPRGTFENKQGRLFQNNLSRNSLGEERRSDPLRQKVLLIALPLILVLWSFLSILWSEVQIIAFFRSVKLLEFYLLYIYILFRIFPELINILMLNCSTPVCRQGKWNNPTKIGFSDTQNSNLFNKHPIVPRGTIGLTISLFKRDFFFIIIIFLAIFHSFIGILQFITQKSVGLYFIGESMISPEIAGVAKIIFDGERYIRAYGLFPHPNILGGFLVFSIITTFLFKRLFHICPVNCSTWNNLLKIKKFNVKKGIFFNSIFVIQAVALILTFSKSAIIGLGLGCVYLFINSIVPRGTMMGLKSKLFHIYPVNCSTWNNSTGMEQFKLKHLLNILLSRRILLGIGFVLIFFLFIKPDIHSFLTKSLDERLFHVEQLPYVNVPRGTIMYGIGMGQFIPALKSLPNILPWQIQPIHNVFILIASELGIIGLFVFLWFLYKLFHLPCRQTGVEQFVKNNILQQSKVTMSTQRDTITERLCLIKTHFKSILIAFIFIMLFDHYFWTIQQGQIFLWVALAAIAGIEIQLKTPKK